MSLDVHWRLGLWHVMLVLLAFLIFGPGTETIVFASVVLVAAAVLVLRLRTQLIGPLSKLSAAVRSAVGGSAPLPSMFRGAPVIEDLSKNLGDWSDGVQERLKDTSDARRRLESILDAMVEGVLVFGPDERIILSNQGVLRLMEGPRDLNGKTCLEVFRNESLDLAVRDTFRGKHADTVQFHTGSGRVVRALLSPVIGEDETGVEAVVTVLHDLTDIQQADRVRRDFVANVSHEFKTPLTSICGYAETIMSETGNESQKEFAKIIHRNGRYLESLVNDILVLARIESEQALALESLNLQSLIDEQISIFRRLPAAESMKIEVDCPEIGMRADRGRLRTALGNLIDNAIRYNRPGGEIRVTARRDNAHVAIAVSDSGFGIPDEELPRIFERFYRVDKARTRDSGGTGLGLAIAKHAVESHRGVLSVESTVGSGSTFTIRLPANM